MKPSGSEGGRSPRILYLGFFLAMDPTVPVELERFRREKQGKFFVWPSEWESSVFFSGLGRGWRGWRSRDGIESHAWMPVTPWATPNALLAWIGHVRDIQRLAKKGTTVVFCSLEGGFGGALTKLIRPKRVRLVVRVEGDSGTHSLRRGEKRRYLARRSIAKFVARRADLVIPNSAYTANLALSLGAKRERVLVSMSRPRWDEGLPAAALPAHPTILYAGRLFPEKGLDVLLEAMRKVAAIVPGGTLLIAGDGPERDRLLRRTRTLGLEGYVQVLGHLEEDDLWKAYASARAVVLPSLWGEGWSQALTEAALIGRPLIASDIGALREVVRHGESGLLVPPGDPSALAEAILVVLTDEERAARMSECARAAAHAWLRERRMAAERVRDALREVVSGGTHG